MPVLFHYDSWFGIVGVKISLFAFAAQSSIADNQSEFDLEVFDSTLATGDRRHAHASHRGLQDGARNHCVGHFDACPSPAVTFRWGFHRQRFILENYYPFLLLGCAKQFSVLTVALGCLIAQIRWPLRGGI
jgi:hypothetical protein